MKEEKTWVNIRLESLDHDAETLFKIRAEINALKAKLKPLEKEAEQYEKAFKEALKDADVGLCDGYRIEYKRTDTTRFDQQAFKADHPAEFERYTKKTIVRRFDIKEGDRQLKAGDFKANVFERLAKK